MKKVLLFCIALSVGGGFAALAHAAAVISQVQITGGSGKASEDFIELFNPADAPLNLNGYRLVKRTATGTEDTLIKSWTTDTFIPARSFYLWANSNFSSITSSPDETTSASLADNNGIALRLGANNTGTIVGSIAWGNTDNGFTNVSTVNLEANQALVRQDLYAASSGYALTASAPRNTAVKDASATTTPEQPDPPATTTPEQVPPANQNPPQNSGGSAPEVLTKSIAIKISEIYPNPPGEDSGAEQIELINTGNKAVNLDGWFLGDTSDTGVKSNAYKISSFILGPGAVQSIILPKGSFSLNNAGDTVHLYFADKTSADTVTYAAGGEGLSYQLVSGQWLWQAPSLNSANSVAAPAATAPLSSYPVTVELNELLPNPAGSDEGKEWIEVTNTGTLPVSLKGYMLGNGGAEPGSSPYIISEDIMVAADGYAIVALPEDSITLTNTADAISLFAPNRQFIERVSYEKAEEDKSLSKNKTGTWEFGLPTPGRENVVDIPLYAITISELLPNPGSDQDEFIELQNVGNNSLDLNGFTVTIGTRRMAIETDTLLKPGEYFVLYEDQLPLALRNSGQTILVSDSFGRPTVEVAYPKAASGLAYVRTAAGTYVWTLEPTPGTENREVLGATVEAEVKTEKAVPASSAGSKTAAARELTAAQLNAALETQNRELEAKLAAVEGKLNAILVQLSAEAGIPVAEASLGTEVLGDETVTSNPYGYLAGSAAILLLAAWLFRSFLHTRRVHRGENSGS